MAKTFKDSRDRKQGATLFVRAMRRQREEAQAQRRARYDRKDILRRAALEELLSSGEMV